ncbi:DUF4229 domain-containing protein [Actinotalea subterranea]|uniref:DUF4229 domain-containing protein n=1 Tax=Actinotalea subterranea TaxID=2607497 RepID=UPI001CAA8A4E|nr:DUF4229 domain-containing protein [Actinotalea subterranea]
MPLVVYSALRLGLFAAALGALWWVGLGGWLLVVVAAVVAWALSYVLLAGPRDAAALWLAGRAERRAAGRRFSAQVESDAAAEDAEASVVEARVVQARVVEGPDPQVSGAGGDRVDGGDVADGGDGRTGADGPADGESPADADGDGAGPQSASPRPSSTP